MGSIVSTAVITGLLVVALFFAARSVYRNKNTGRAKKHIVFNDCAGIELHVVFDRHAISNPNTAFQKAVFADIAVDSNRCAG